MSMEFWLWTSLMNFYYDVEIYFHKKYNLIRAPKTPVRKQSAIS